MRNAADGLCVVSAPPGSGLTTLIDAIARENMIDPIRIYQPIRGVKDVLESASRNTRSPLGHKKCIIIDPFDAVLSEASCATVVTDFLKRGPRNAIPVLIAGFRQRVSTVKVEDIVKKYPAHRVLRVCFPPLESETVIRYIGGGDAARHAWEASNHDLRNCIQALHFGQHNVKDVQCDGFDAITHIVLSKPRASLRDAMRLVEADSSMIAGGIFENYTTWSTLESCVRTSENMSVADVFGEAVYVKGAWDLVNHHVACIAGACVDTPSTRSGTAAHLSKYGTVWSRGNNQRTKEKVARTLHMPVTDVAFFRGIVHSAVANDDMVTVHRVMESYGPEKVLAIMRLWSKSHHKYTISMHKRFASEAR